MAKKADDKKRLDSDRTIRRVALLREGIKAFVSAGQINMPVSAIDVDTLTLALTILERVGDTKWLAKEFAKIKLSQAGWEGEADIVTCNGKPIGGTIRRHSRQFDRWWGKELFEIIAQSLQSSILDGGGK